MDNQPVLVTKGLTKQFPGVKALDGVDFVARAGEVHALMGENGAGKSTLIRLVTGVYQRDSGQVMLEGEEIHPHSPLAAQQLGIATVYQEVNLVPSLSVAENIMLGRLPRKFGMIDGRSMRRQAEAALARLGVTIDVRRPVGEIPIALQQMAAIARALTLSAKVLILDEPTSSLDRAEVARLFDVMKLLKGEGLAIVFVTHFMDQVYAISDRITVLRNGALVGEAMTKDLPRLELVARMVGKDADELAKEQATPHAPPPPAGRDFVRATGVGIKNTVGPLDLDIRHGEVVGLAGLLGSGRTETAEMVFGVRKHDQGTINVDGVPQKLTAPRQAIALGFGFCPEDRKTTGILPNLSVRENIIIALQARRGWWKPIPLKRQMALANRYIKALRIKTPDGEKSIRLLSGGNQQKAILARWMAASPRLLVLDEPTRGIDIGAKAEIAALVDKLRDDGLSLLVISSEVEELVRMCSRIVVLRDRHRVGELTGGEITEPAVFRKIAG